LPFGILRRDESQTATSQQQQQQYNNNNIDTSLLTGHERKKAAYYLKQKSAGNYHRGKLTTKLLEPSENDWIKWQRNRWQVRRRIK
jgi:hypothetical protein